MSYKRPGNIGRILRSLNRCRFVTEIILSNNNPDIRITDHLDVDDPRLRVLEQGERRYPSIRLELSRQARCHHLISIDDDIFPEPEQILALYDALRTEPGAPHGFGGQIYGGRPGEDRTRFVSNRNLPVESLVWIFAYTQDHVNRYFELLARAGLDNESLRFNEDVPLSFSGDTPARAHFVGPLRHCETSKTAGIASWREEGFTAQRAQLIRSMREITGRHVASGADRTP